MPAEFRGRRALAHVMHCAGYALLADLPTGAVLQESHPLFHCAHHIYGIITSILSRVPPRRPLGPAGRAAALPREFAYVVALVVRSRSAERSYCRRVLHATAQICAAYSSAAAPVRAGDSRRLWPGVQVWTRRVRWIWVSAPCATTSGWVLLPATAFDLVPGPPCDGVPQGGFVHPPFARLWPCSTTPRRRHGRLVVRWWLHSFRRRLFSLWLLQRLSSTSLAAAGFSAEQKLSDEFEADLPVLEDKPCSERDGSSSSSSSSSSI